MVAGVIGWPIAQSLSPRLHTAWIQALGLDAVYAAFPVNPDDLSTAVDGAKALGLKGLNVTAPYKDSVFTLCDEVSARAQRIAAVNLLTFDKGGACVGESTDGEGFMAGLTAAGGADLTAPIAMLGAGGAGRAVLAGLRDAGAAGPLRLTNRTSSKADAVADWAQSDGWPDVAVIPWDDRNRALAEAGLVINATALGLPGKPALAYDPSAAHPDALFYDLVYSPSETGFVAAARAVGRRATDGLNMLIGQARPSFEAFFGVAAPVLGDEQADLRQVAG